MIDVKHEYCGKGINCLAVRQADMTIPDGKFVILWGQSGSGKTTLLNIIGGIMKPTSGRVVVDNQDVYALNDKDLSKFRQNTVGFVFQNYFLDESFTAIENVLIPLFLDSTLTSNARIDRAIDLLKSVNLGERLNHRPPQLSGGECQRIAIARALANNPKYIIADEPTGNLDMRNGDCIVEILRNQVKNGKTVIMVTHNRNYLHNADIVYEIQDGVVSKYE